MRQYFCHCFSLLIVKDIKSDFSKLHHHHYHNNIKKLNTPLTVVPKKKNVCCHDKNYYYFCKSNIPVINLIVGSRNMIKLSKSMSLSKIS